MYGSVVLSNTREYRIHDELVFNCLSSFWELLRRKNTDKVLFMSVFNLPDEDWANIPDLEAETLTSTMSFFNNQQFHSIIHRTNS